MVLDTLDASAMIPLSELVENGTEPEITAPIFPGLGCGFFTVSLILPSIRKACSVMIAPALCAHNARLLVSHWEHSSMDIENNLVFLLYDIRVVVANRYLITIQGNNMARQDLISFAQGIDFQKLAEMP